MHIVGIVRVSTEEQRGKDDEGLERQRAALRGILKALSEQRATMDVVEITGVSGSDVADSMAWRKDILPALRSGAHLAADSIDRLIRASAFDLRVLEALHQFKSKLYLPGRLYDAADARDRLALHMFSALGGFEKSEIVRRAQAGKEQKRLRGEWVNRLESTALGTKYDRKARRWEVTDDAPRILEAFEAFVSGASFRSIAPLVGRTPAGTRNLFRNEIYRGLLRFTQRRGEKYPSVDGKQADRRRVARPEAEVIEVRVYGGEGQEPQIVPDQLWDAAQLRLREIGQTGRKRRERTAPMIWASGFLFSTYEGAHTPGLRVMDMNEPDHVLYGKASGERRLAHYVCRCRGRDPAAPPSQCAMGYLQARVVNGALDAYFARMTREPATLEQVREALNTTQGDTKGRERLAKTIGEADKKEKRIIDLYSDGAIDRADLDRRLAVIREQRTYARKTMDYIAVIPDGSELGKVEKEWCFDPGWPPQRKREWLSKYVQAVVVSMEGLVAVDLRLPFGNETGVTFRSSNPRTWQALLGGKIATREDRLATNGKLTAGEVVRLLGWPPGYASTNRLAYLVRTGRVPEPSSRWGLKGIWTAAEAEAVVSAVRRLGGKTGE